MRVALLTMESPLASLAVDSFLRDPGPAEIVLVGLSDPWRRGGAARLAQLARGSGWRLLPYLLAQYALPACRGPGPIARTAAELGLRRARLADVNAATALRDARPDLLVALHFDQILDPATLAMAPSGGLNVHPSLLPRHRGPVPTLWALAEQPPATGVSVHRMVPRIDAGPVLAQRVLPLPARTTAAAAARMLHAAGVPLLREAVARLAAGTADPPPPPLLPYCPFPPATTLRAWARRGVRLCDGADWRVALAAG